MCKILARIKAGKGAKTQSFMGLFSFPVSIRREFRCQAVLKDQWPESVLTISDVHLSSLSHM